MAINYTWNFSSFKVNPLLDSLKDVLVSYEWRRIATDGEYTIDVYGTISLPDPNPENFDDYNKITKNDLEEWTISQLTQKVVDNYDSYLKESILALANPPLVNKNAPWD